jgi:hypothetical protein
VTSGCTTVIRESLYLNETSIIVDRGSLHHLSKRMHGRSNLSAVFMTAAPTASACMFKPTVHLKFDMQLDNEATSIMIWSFTSTPRNSKERWPTRMFARQSTCSTNAHNMQQAACEQVPCTAENTRNTMSKDLATEYVCSKSSS